VKTIDANIILRYLTNDVPEQAARSAILIQKIKAGKEHVYLPDIFIADIIWILEKFYKTSRENIKNAITAIVTMPGMVTADIYVILAALDTYSGSKIDWSDSLAAAQMLNLGMDTIYTFDKHFDEIDGITRIEP